MRLKSDIDLEIINSFYPRDPNSGFPTTNESFHFWLHSFLDSGVMPSANKNLFFNPSKVFISDYNLTELTSSNDFGQQSSYHLLEACQFTYSYEFSNLVSDNIRFVNQLNQEVIVLNFCYKTFISFIWSNLIWNGGGCNPSQITDAPFVLLKGSSVLWT